MIVTLKDVEMPMYSVNEFTDKESGDKVKFFTYTFRDSFGKTLEANSKADYTSFEREKVDVELDVDKFGGKWQIKVSCIFRAGVSRSGESSGEPENPSDE